MIPGINQSFQLDGHDYIIQGEDQGEAQACFDVRVMEQGSIVWQKRLSYQDLLDQELPQPEMQKKLRAQVERTLEMVKVGLERGKLK